MKLLIVTFFTAIILLNMTGKDDQGVQENNFQNQKPVFSFGIIADVQYCNCEPLGSRFYRNSKTKLREALATFKNDSVSFVINLGDLIDKDFRSYKPITDIIDSSGLKIYHVAGNHDYMVEPRYKKRLPVLTPSKDGYYSMKYENFRFIFLNGNEISTYISTNKAETKNAEDNLAGMKERGEINAVEWNGGFGNKQLDWLRLQLNDAAARNEQVFLICHFPVVPENVHNLLNYKKVLALLENYRNIIAWFNGHNHAGNYGNFNMIHFVTFKGMVETESDNSFAQVDVYRNKLLIRGYGREKSQILAY